MAKLRLTMTMSLDGCEAGTAQCRKNPLGEGGTALHGWAFATRGFRAMHGLGIGETGVDDGLS